MMEQGLSEDVYARLGALRRRNAVPDTELGALAMQALEAEEARRKAENVRDMLRTMQMFVNPQLYTKVYDADDNGGMTTRRESAGPPPDIDLASLNALLNDAS